MKLKRKPNAKIKHEKQKPDPYKLLKWGGEGRTGNNERNREA